MSQNLPTHRTIDWNDLDPRTRRRFIDAVGGNAEPRALLSQHALGSGAVVGWLFLTLCGLGTAVLLAAIDFGSVYNFRQPLLLIAGYAFLFFFTLWTVLRAIRSVRLNVAVPFKRGRYVFPTDLVIANDARLTVVSLGRLLKLDGVHRHVNGAYSATDLTFVFEGYGRETFVVQGKERAEQVLDNLRAIRQRIADAARANDMATLASLDLFFESRHTPAFGGSAIAALGGDAFAQIAQQVGGAPAPMFQRSADDPKTRAKKISPLLERAALVSLAAMLFAPPFWFARNFVSDEAAFVEAKSINTTWVFQAYLDSGGRHRSEVRDRWLPEAAFADAQRTGTVTALREFVRAHSTSPRVPEARAIIHQRFLQVRQDFMAQASTTDPRMPVFMGHLLDWLEAHDSPPVQVRFLAPTSETLALVDQNLDTIGRLENVRGGMAPVSPHFTAERSAPREGRITEMLQRGFAPIFPTDVMQLTHAGRIDGPTAAAAIAVPVFDVSYAIRPSGSVYTSDTSTRGFVGIVISFHIQMRIPQSAETWAFDTTVQPPEHFTVSTTDSFGLGGDEAYRDGLVYSVMADRAFDQLSNQLALSFFRADSNAYAQAQAAAAQQHQGGSAVPTGFPSPAPF